MPGEHKVTEINHEPETISSQGFRYKQTLSLDHPGVFQRPVNSLRHQIDGRHQGRDRANRGCAHNQAVGAA